MPAMLTLGLDEKRKTANIAIGIPGEKPWASIDLDPKELDLVIERLALVRASLGEEIAVEPTRPVMLIEDPTYHVEIDPARGGTTIVLRHAGLGWLGFNFPQHECQTLAPAFEAGTKQERVRDSTPSNVTTLKPKS